MDSDIKLADGKGLIRGDDYTIKADFGIDITGATVWFTVSEDDDPASDSTAAFQKVNGPSDHVDATTGKTNFAIIGSEDTAPLDGGTYYYDLQVVTAGGQVSSTRKGKILIDSDITRSTEVTS